MRLLLVAYCVTLLIICNLLELKTQSIHDEDRAIYLSITKSYMIVYRNAAKLGESVWNDCENLCKTVNGRLAWIPEFDQTSLAIRVFKMQLAKLLNTSESYYIGLYKKRDDWYWSAGTHIHLHDKEVSDNFKSVMNIASDASYKFGILSTEDTAENIAFSSAPDNLNIAFLCEEVTCPRYQPQNGELITESDYNPASDMSPVHTKLYIDCRKGYQISRTVPAVVQCQWNSTWNSTHLCTQIKPVHGDKLCRTNLEDWLALCIYSALITIGLSMAIITYVFVMIHLARMARKKSHALFVEECDGEKRCAPTAQAEISFIEEADGVFFQGHPLAGRMYNYYSKGVTQEMTKSSIQSAWICGIIEGRENSNAVHQSRCVYLPDISDTLVVPPGVAMNDDLCHQQPKCEDRMAVFFCDIIVPLIAEFINKCHDERLCIDDYSPTSDVSVSTLAMAPSESMTSGAVTPSISESTATAHSPNPNKMHNIQ